MPHIYRKLAHKNYATCNVRVNFEVKGQIPRVHEHDHVMVRLEVRHNFQMRTNSKLGRTIYSKQMKHNRQS